MSLPSKVTFVATCIASASIIVYVHLKQKWDRDELKKGLEIDRERLQRKKETLENLKFQQVLRSALEVETPANTK